MYVSLKQWSDGRNSKTEIHANIELLEASLIKDGFNITEDMRSIIKHTQEGESYIICETHGANQWCAVTYFPNREIVFALLNEEVPTIAISNDNLTIDDRCEIFRTVLYGSSDVTGELLQSVVNEYSVGGIEIIDSNIYE